jgi:hypothetical protein
MFDMYFIFTKEKFDLDNLLNKVENKFWVELNKKDIIARLLYLSKSLDEIKPFLIDNIDFNIIKDFYEKMV